MNGIINNLGNNWPIFVKSLSTMVYGMAGIFLVLIILFISIKLLLKIFPPKAE